MTDARPSHSTPGTSGDDASSDPSVSTRVQGFVQGAELGPVAELLTASRDDILGRWLQAARRQPFHVAQPERAVADHIPHLFDALVAFLRRNAPREIDPSSPLDDEAVRAAARAHASDRFRQGLAAAEVLTEFRLLRQEIGRALRERSDTAGDVLAAELLVHDALDGATTLGVAALEAHEAEYHRVAAELAAIVESSSDAIIGKTLDGIITSWNPGAERMYGYTAAEAVGQPMSLMIPSDRPDELPSILSRIRRGERVEPYETVRVRKDGHRLRVSVTVSPICDRAGAVVGASASARDITERTRAEAALAESEERFRTLADNIAQLAWMADPTGWIFWYNRRWFDYTGTTLSQMQGWGWTKVHHPEHVDRVVARIQRAWETGEVWEDTFPLRGADGRYRWFLSRALPIRDDQGRIVRWFGTNTDITELRETEAALRRSEQERRGLVAAIAHDLKNPLTSIKGLAQMLQRQADAGSLTPERLSDRLGALVASADRMTAQLDELSLITRGEDLRIQLDRRRTDLVTLVREAAAGRQLGSEAHAIQLECNVEQLVGSFDATRLARVVDNLLVNAVKYSPSGGTVTVQVRRTERAGVPWACLTVRDRGIGIPDADLPHVFERFRRGGNVRGISGTGVGLAAVREIVEAHGGTIEVASREGEGSTFTVWLPLVESEAQAGQP